MAAGPYATKYLAEHGATVIKVESLKNPDINRAYVPMAGGISGINRCGIFNWCNNDKYCMSLDLTHPRAPEVARKLVDWADIVVENFRPQVMERRGLGYEDLRKIKNDIIMVRVSSLGQEGPHALLRGLGPFLVGLAGFTPTLGWPDRPPIGPTTVPYTDHLGSLYATIAILGAIDYRRRTGEGQCIDLSQVEAGVTTLASAILDYEANDRDLKLVGNHHQWACPHGVFRCQGDDRWCAIAVFSDEEWQYLCRAMGSPDWSTDSKWATVESRKANEDELETLIEKWTIQQSSQEVMNILQRSGVRSGIVQSAEELVGDPQLEHRHHFRSVEHPEVGKHLVEAPAFVLSETPAELKMPAPCMGEHTEYVCTEILGMSDEEFVELVVSGVLE
ncbi:MAG: CoA transferase [Chloroflexi bacterium]|nr:CoA transferase [Chloroflexota bacterium]